MRLPEYLICPVGTSGVMHLAEEEEEEERGEGKGEGGERRRRNRVSVGQ